MGSLASFLLSFPKASLAAAVFAAGGPQEYIIFLPLNFQVNALSYRNAHDTHVFIHPFSKHSWAPALYQSRARRPDTATNRSLPSSGLQARWGDRAQLQYRVTRTGAGTTGHWEHKSGLRESLLGKVAAPVSSDMETSQRRLSPARGPRARDLNCQPQFPIL